MHHTAATSAGGATVAAGNGNPTNSTVSNLSQMAKVLPQIIDGIVIFISFHRGFFWFFFAGFCFGFILTFSVLFTKLSSILLYLLLYVLSLNIYSNEKNVQIVSSFCLFASMYLLDWFFTISNNDLIESFEYKSHFPITGKSNCNWFFVPSPIRFQNIFGRSHFVQIETSLSLDSCRKQAIKIMSSNESTLIDFFDQR